MPKSKSNFRTEHDSLGAVEVPSEALYGAQTQRAVNNFQYSGLTMPTAWLQTLARLKLAAATVNGELGEISPDKAVAIASAAEKIVAGEYQDQFPVDIFQTGSGTSSNMNMNEVLATLATQTSGLDVHANNDVNRGQSSNDIVPSANQLNAAMQVRDTLMPALASLQNALHSLSQRHGDLLKTGRTHLMDAMPLSVAQEISGWQGVIADLEADFQQLLPRLCRITLGGTAVGTGVNAHPEFADRVAARLAEQTGLPITRTHNHFSAQSGQSDQQALSGTLKNLATWLIKISNDLRWMNSGPLAGLAEVQLPALQPGSSIMPGKVNPVVPEAVIQAAFQVIGNDSTITLGAQNGQFQLNTSLPLIGYNIQQSIDLMANAMTSLGRDGLQRLSFNAEALAGPLARNPILATALNNEIGYDLAGKIAKEAYASGRSVLDVAKELTDLDHDTLQKLLDPGTLT